MWENIFTYVFVLTYDYVKKITGMGTLSERF